VPDQDDNFKDKYNQKYNLRAKPLGQLVFPARLRAFLAITFRYRGDIDSARALPVQLSLG
jgi:hypothetical protein